MSLIDKAKGAAQGAVQAAAKKAAEIAPDRMIPGGKPDPLIHQKHGLVGQPISRLDGPLKVKGAARFAAEFPLEGMTYAAVAYSIIPKGRIARIESAAAESASGVILVMTHRNAPKMNPPPRFMSGEKAAAGDDIPVMQDDRVHWNGQPVALILAETQEQADHAKSLIKISYKEERATTSLADAKAKGTEVGKFQGEPLEDKIGDTEAALSEAVHRVDEVYTTPGHNHNAMELHAITVMWRGEDLVVHDATQAVSHSAWSLAHIFDIDEKQVHLTSPYVGGGFGGKTLWQHQILAAAAARMSSRPVRLVLSREGVYRVVGGRSSTEQRVALGADADGRLTALIHQGVTPKSRASAMPEPFILPSRSAYASPNIHLQVKTCYLDMLANTFMRAPGESVGTFALECAMDELAYKAGIDPIELRIRNEPAKDPTSGLPFSSRHIVEAYKMGAEKFGWQGHSRTPRVRQDGEWLVGVGCATATYPYHRMPGGAARITLLQEGRAIVEIAAHEMGMGTSTAQTQIAADRLGLQMNDVNFLYGDSSLPGIVLAGGSQQTAAIGMAVRVAYDRLVEDLIKLAGNDSPLAGLRSDEVVGTNRGLAKLDEQDRFESYTSILSRAKRGSVVAEGAAPQPLETMHWSMHSHGAMFCEVKVNSVTGETRVSRFLGSFDCGRIINPKTATSQFRGGIIMGVGLALMEETQFDERRGRIMNPSLSEYHVPVHLDVPQIDVMWTDIADPHAPMGAHGIGEIGITGTGAAIANAIFNATGKRVRDLPITLDKLLG
jgi:xanthine dehydrogenase YagR molybdenum-binding subunit